MTDPMTLDPNHRLKFDGTINIPTIFIFITSLVGTVLWFGALYRDLDNRVTGDSKDTTILKRDVERLEVTTAELRRDQVQKLDALRGEMRGELRDVNDKLDRLLLRKADR